MPFNCSKSEQLSLILTMTEHHTLHILKCCSEVVLFQHLPNGPFQNGVRSLALLQTCRNTSFQITALFRGSDQARCTVARNPKCWFSTLLHLDSYYQDKQLSSKPLSLGWTLQLHMSSSSQPQLPWSLTDYRQIREKKQENSRNDQKLNSHKSANHNRAYRTQRKSIDKRAVSAKLCSNKLLARL